MSDRWGVRGYTELRPLGGGGTGTVVLATAPTGDLVAIKYLAPDLLAEPGFRDAFRAEVRQLARLRTPHVVQLYDYVETDQGAAIVMQLVEGASLRATLTEHGATGPEPALAVLKGSLLGLREAHRIGVVHRAFRPENVLIALDGRAVLADFGMAGRAEGAAGGGEGAAGAPADLAPESWSGGAAGPSGDLYAATATFVECLLGRPPERGGLPEGGGPAEPVRELVRRVLAGDPAKRPADAGAFLGELERVAAAGYGEGWEERGRAELGRRAALLAPPPIPATAPSPPGGTAEVPSGPVRGGRAKSTAGTGRVSAGLLVAGFAAALAVGGLVAGALIGGPRPITPSAPTGETRLDVPADDGGAPAIGDPPAPALVPPPAAPPAPLPALAPPSTAPGSDRDDDERDRDRDQDSDDGDSKTGKAPKEKSKKKSKKKDDGGSTGSGTSGDGGGSPRSSDGGSSGGGQPSGPGAGGADSGKDGAGKDDSGKEGASKDGAGKDGSSSG